MRRREKETGGILTNPTSGTKHSTVFQKVMQSMCLFYQRNRVWLPVTETRLILAHTDRNLFESHNEQPGMDRQGLGKQPNDAVKNTGPLGLSLHCHQNIGLHVLCCCLLIDHFQVFQAEVHGRQVVYQRNAVCPRRLGKRRSKTEEGIVMKEVKLNSSRVKGNPSGPKTALCYRHSEFGGRANPFVKRNWVGYLQSLPEVWTLQHKEPAATVREQHITSKQKLNFSWNTRMPQKIFKCIKLFHHICITSEIKH